MIVTYDSPHYLVEYLYIYGLLLISMTKEGQNITDEQLESLLPTFSSYTKIGSKKKTIQVLRNLGYDSFEELKESFEKESRYPIFRLGNTYYW